MKLENEEKERKGGLVWTYHLKLKLVKREASLKNAKGLQNPSSSTLITEIIN